MSRIRRLDHVGITVADLDAVSAFFVQLGLEIEGRTSLEGDFLDTVIGIRDAHTEIVLLRAPDGGAGLELARFIRPDHEPGSAAAMATELGLRSVAFEVDDPQVIVERARGGWLRPGRRHRRVRARLAHGLLARARGDRRLPR
jgi:catechol 2,3-dioxygenase-like lactoylglutathione lyase family enzyme